MAKRDKYHDAIKRALTADGWTITHDPYRLWFGIRRALVDLGAARTAIGAVQGERKIAVEIKSFTGPSELVDLEHAVGQYVVYKSWLARKDPERALYLAVRREIVDSVFADISAQVILQDYQIRLIVVDVIAERIIGWIE